jgi:2-keto-4-pentenoate hydratase
MDTMIEESARALHHAERSRVPIAPLSEQYPSLTPAQSYAIQSAWLDLLRGEGASVKLAEFGVSLHRGQVILPGAMCAAVSVASGKTYRAVYTHLGEVSVRFE